MGRCEARRPAEPPWVGPSASRHKHGDHHSENRKMTKNLGFCSKDSEVFEEKSRKIMRFAIDDVTIHMKMLFKQLVDLPQFMVMLMGKNADIIIQ